MRNRISTKVRYNLYKLLETEKSLLEGMPIGDTHHYCQTELQESIPLSTIRQGMKDLGITPKINRKNSNKINTLLEALIEAMTFIYHRHDEELPRYIEDIFDSFKEDK